MIGIEFQKECTPQIKWYQLQIGISVGVNMLTEKGVLIFLQLAPVIVVGAVYDELPEDSCL